MAQNLHDNYGFSYDNVKVLLGGWNTWKQESDKDPNKYPVEITPGTTPGAGGGNATIVLEPGITQVTPAPTPKP